MTFGKTETLESSLHCQVKNRMSLAAGMAAAARRRAQAPRPLDRQDAKPAASVTYFVTGIGSWSKLFVSRSSDFLAVGSDDLEVVNAVTLAISKLPNHFFISSDFKQFGGVTIFAAASVTGDHQVAVGQ
ncbi:hypothetical protein SV7mr_17210 [Stieleria bergensis]|uniref:Uncharacterized protein n=1 Tax=Stieleria bergensis TaxID=2528025 RepID=A0A517SSV3_9BACT|nr:hypothetical protein SV7mr_17210 [Planctomycetes bacterium SV_7m_r]